MSHTHTYMHAHTHMKWAEKKNSSILLQHADFLKRGTNQLCLPDCLRHFEAQCECMYACVQVDQCEREPSEDCSRPVFSQGPEE